MSRANLEKFFGLADEIDRSEGESAYIKYHEVMKSIAARYGSTVEKAAAVFAALSPNNDYLGNLRSAINVFEGIENGTPAERIGVTTYRHCLLRAYAYATGTADFRTTVKGPKIYAFYHNLIDPSDTRYVTIDGHMVAAWRDERLAMKDALVSLREYRRIEAELKALAFSLFIIPNQLQATIWFTRKRLFRIRYQPQLNLFAPKDDAWGIMQSVK